MYCIKRNLKYIVITIFMYGFVFNLFLKTVHGESIVSDATVEVVQEDPAVIPEDHAQDQLPKTNEQMNHFFVWLGILMIIFWAKSLYDKFRL